MKKDLLYKVLFAVEMALLPLVIFAYIYMPSWSVGLFVAGVLLCKIWRELFKDKYEKIQIVISSISSVITNTVLLSVFMVAGALNKVVGIITIIVIALKVLFDVFAMDVELPEFIESVKFCFMMFECLILIAMLFALSFATVLTIASIATILTGVAYVGYLGYVFVKNMSQKTR